MRASAAALLGEGRRAAVVFVVVGMIWGILMAISEDHSAMLAHAHLPQDFADSSIDISQRIKVRRLMSSRPSGALDLENPLIQHAWLVAWLQLQDCRSYDGLGAMLSRQSPRSPLTASIVVRARAVLPRLIQSARQLDIVTSLSVALPLLGAGPGLTPSWDDLLIGLLCGLRATSGSNLNQSRFIRQFGLAMSSASEKTTAVSRAYIQRTLDGAGPVWVEDVLVAIAAGDSFRTHSATARALRIGHTSGADMMLGVMLGSSIWQDGSEVDQVLSAMSCGRSDLGSTRDDHSELPTLPEPV